MMWKSFRLTKEDKEKLEEMAGQRGMTLSDLIRDSIRNSYQQHVIVNALQEVRNYFAQEIAQLREEVRSPQKGDAGGTREAEIKRIVMEIDKRTAEQHRVIILLGQASPFVSRQLGQM